MSPSNETTVGIVSTFPPEQCGVAEFAQDHFEYLADLPGYDPVKIDIRDMDTVRSIWFRGGIADIDIYHAHHQFNLYKYRGAMLARLRNAPLVTTLHDGAGKTYYPEWQLSTIDDPKDVLLNGLHELDMVVQSWIVSHSAATIVHTRADRTDLRRRYDGNVVTKPMGCEPKETTDSDTLNTVLLFGFLRGEKNVEALIESARFHDKDIIVAGSSTDESYAKRLRRLAARHEQVSLEIKWHSEAEKDVAFERADCVALPYGDIPSGSGVLFDALSYGRPLLCSEAPIFEEVVGEDGAGVLVEPEPEQIADRITELASEYPRYRDNAKSERGRYTWPAVVEAYADVYESCL